jgi:hypothetical protein
VTGLGILPSSRHWRVTVQGEESGSGNSLYMGLTRESLCASLRKATADDGKLAEEVQIDMTMKFERNM